MIALRAAITMAVLLQAAVPLSAAGTGGCESFEFPLVAELEWMRRETATPVAAGATLRAPPAEAMTVTLLPMADVTFPVPPEGRKGEDATLHGAVIQFESIAAPGLYQIALSHKGWIDAVQDGVTVKSTAHTGKSDCEGLRKAIRFELKSGPLTVQLSSVHAPQIRLTVRKVD